MESNKYINSVTTITTEYRLAIPSSTFDTILFMDTRKRLSLKKKLFMLKGITGVRYLKANHSSILFRIQKHMDTKEHWRVITLTIKEHTEEF